MKFDWDEKKAKINARVHGVNFSDAESVFADLNAVEFFDDLHSDFEERFRRVGLSGANLLFVIYTIRDEIGGETIRLISARRANIRERKIYEQYNR